MGGGLTTYEWIQIFLAVLFGIGTIVGPFILRSINEKIAEAKAHGVEAKEKAEEMEKDLNAYKVYAAENYARAARIESLEKALFSKLDRIEQMLDQKLTAINHRIDGKQDKN